MTQNLLSNQPDTKEATTLQKKTTSSSVAFRVPAPEEKSGGAGSGSAGVTTASVGKIPRPAPKPATPLPKQPLPTPLRPQSSVKSVTPPASVVTPPAPRDTYTTPEDFTKGFGVDILGGASAVKKETSSTQLAALVGGAAGIVLVALGVWFWVLAVEKGDLTRTQGERTARVAELKQFLATVKDEKKQIESQRKTIATARELLSQHLYWTRFFGFLEAVTLPDVYYTNLSVDPSGRIRLAAVGRDFSAVARQLLAMEEAEDVETVRMTKAAAETTGAVPGVQFDLEIAVKPALLFFRE